MNAFIITLDNRPGSAGRHRRTPLPRRGSTSPAWPAPRRAAPAPSHSSPTTRPAPARRSRAPERGFREVALASAALEDKPGTLADAARRLADAGVNIEAIFPTGMEGGKITVAFGVDNVEAAKTALGQLTGASA